VVDIRTALNQGSSATRLVAEVGLEAVLEEMREMTGDDMADVTLKAALELLKSDDFKNERRLLSLKALAARIILCGSYGERASVLAAQQNTDLDLAEVRKKILTQKK
jgi:hypothetical protein